MPAMHTAVIIYNPAAGRFSVKPFIKSAVEELESAGWQVDAEATKSGDHTIELAKQAAAEKKDAVFAVGGDGTIGNTRGYRKRLEHRIGVAPFFLDSALGASQECVHPCEGSVSSSGCGAV
jgi:diacylglycerol kinase family enzyme